MDNPVSSQRVGRAAPAAFLFYWNSTTLPLPSAPTKLTFITELATHCGLHICGDQPHPHAVLWGLSDFCHELRKAAKARSQDELIGLDRRLSVVSHFHDVQATHSEKNAAAGHDKGVGHSIATADNDVDRRGSCAFARDEMAEGGGIK